MTAAGWITMLLSVAFAWTLFVWCISKVLSKKAENLVSSNMHTPDMDEEDD